jgi:hypothetical protein
MTITRRTGTIKFICDECGDELDTEIDQYDEFSLAVNEMKKFGWVSRKNDDTNHWEHLCSICKRTK